MAATLTYYDVLPAAACWNLLRAILRFSPRCMHGALLPGAEILDMMMAARGKWHGMQGATRMDGGSATAKLHWALHECTSIYDRAHGCSQTAQRLSLHVFTFTCVL